MCLLCSRTCAGHPNDTSNHAAPSPDTCHQSVRNLPAASRAGPRVRISFPPLPSLPMSETTTRPRPRLPIRRTTHPPAHSPALQAARAPSVGFHVSHFLAVLPHRLCVSFSTLWCALVLKHASGMVSRDGRARDVRPAACGSAYAV